MIIIIITIFTTYSILSIKSNSHPRWYLDTRTNKTYNFTDLVNSPYCTYTSHGVCYHVIRTALYSLEYLSKFPFENGIDIIHLMLATVYGRAMQYSIYTNIDAHAILTVYFSATYNHCSAKRKLRSLREIPHLLNVMGYDILITK